MTPFYGIQSLEIATEKSTLVTSVYN